MNGSRRLVFAFAVLAMSLASVAAHAEDRLEKQARALFAKGEYEKALDIFATLFSETNDAVYLRNIGRCYQKLQQPYKAIDSFREYLRRGHVKSGERAEVEGFIKEMEELQKERAAKAAPPPSAEPSRPTAHEAEPASNTPPPAAIPAADRTASNAPAPAPTGAAPAQVYVVAARPEAPLPPPERPWQVTAGWVSLGVGAVLLGGAITAQVLASSKYAEFNAVKDAPMGLMGMCNEPSPNAGGGKCPGLLDQAHTRQTIAIVGYVATGVALATSAVLFLTAPSQAASQREVAVGCAPSVGGASCALELRF